MITMKHKSLLCHISIASLLLFTLWGCDQPDKTATTNSDSSTLPVLPASTEWLKTLYTKTIDSNLFNTESLTVIYFTQLNDSTSYCLFQLTDELCTSTFLATQVNRNNKQVRQVEENCDGDFSQPEYAYSNFRFDTLSHTFTTTEYVETANPEFLINENGEKRFRDGYNMDNATTTKDSMALVRKVLPDGQISEASSAK